MNYVNGTSAKGAFITFLPIMPKEGHISKYQVPFSVIVPYNQKSKEISSIPCGIYEVLAYDVESNGYLEMPMANPATYTTIVVLGSSSNEDNSSYESDIEIHTVIDLMELTLKVFCIFEQRSRAESCMVTLRSKELPSYLMVKSQQRGSSKPLVYSVEAQKNYTINVFAIDEDNIQNSTTQSTAVFVGMFVLNSFPKMNPAIL